MIIHDLCEGCLELLWLIQITDSQASPSHLIFVGWANSATCSTDFLITANSLTDLIQGNMMRQNQRAALAHHESIANIDTGVFQHSDFFKKRWN